MDTTKFKFIGYSMEVCPRCGGEGKANPLTHPDQAHCCGLCRGKGKTKCENWLPIKG